MGTRGLRNNNPGNIRNSEVVYRGEIRPSKDASFKQFQTMEDGYRAIFMLLYTYQKRYGLTCIDQFIMRYAPSCENNTNVYIRNVSKWSGHDRYAPINTLTKSEMIPLVAAISRMENGVEAESVSLHKGWKNFIDFL